MVKGESAVRTNSSEVVRELALSGIGIALRSTWDIGTELHAGRLKAVLPQHPAAADVGIFALHPATNFLPASVRFFIDHLRTLYGPGAGMGLESHYVAINRAVDQAQPESAGSVQRACVESITRVLS